ncbi:hypothetical protein NQ176_g10792 [Zarea fungicola]|uniref:Uncharacterized protein n=1 Tax=Zarea fungicola TaxID=93591 RepID=A0ACC1MDJ0_9HYPO|nr:hypothetical protein NQ176_g10792 [Lecanicillium fungicola]
MSQPEATWDLNDDEIASIASEELHENRPNRWKGAKSTWRHFAQEERMLWRSMKQLQDENLGLHLYNAYALKRRAANPATAPDLEDGTDVVWAPPKIWTAWPLRQEHQPPEGLFKDEGDEDDKYTLRQEAKIMPSSILKDELTATILRIAKERFLRRKQPSIRPSIEAPDSPQLESDSDESSSSGSGLNFSSRPSKQATRVPVADEVANPTYHNEPRQNTHYTAQCPCRRPQLSLGLF